MSSIRLVLLLSAGWLGVAAAPVRAQDVPLAPDAPLADLPDIGVA